MKKIKPDKNTWYEWLLNHIPEPIRKIAGGFKDKVVSLFQTNTPKQTEHERGKKLSKSKTQNIRRPCISEENKKKLEDRIIRNIGHFLKQKKKKKEERNQRHQRKE